MKKGSGHSVWSVLTRVPHPHSAPLSLSLVGMQDVKKNKQALWTAVYVGMVQVCCILCLCVYRHVCARRRVCVVLLSFALYHSIALVLSCPLLPPPCGLCHGTGLSCCVRVRLRVNACEFAQAGGTHATARRH